MTSKMREAAAARAPKGKAKLRPLVALGLAALLCVALPVMAQADSQELAESGDSAAADTTIEAESMRLRGAKIARERGASGGRIVTLRRRGSASRRVTTGAVSRLVAVARREPCATRFTPVTMSVMVDGRRALRRTISTTKYVRYSARLSLPAGKHALRVRLSSDRRAGACDRRLRLDRLILVKPGEIEVTVGPAAVGRVAGTPAVGTPVSPPSPPGAPARSPGQLLLRGDFETGDLSQWSTRQSAAPDRITVVRSHVRRGRYAARFEVREGDKVAAGERAEVLWGGSSNLTLREGQEHYIGWSTNFPTAEYPIFTTGHQMVMQTHPKGDLAPPVELTSDAGRLGLKLRNGTPWSAPLTRDVWHDFVLHARWSANPQIGFVELWHNGVKVLPHYSVATLDRSGVDSYLKLGYYRPGAAVSPTGAVYHDEVRVGTSYEDVNPAG